MTEAVPESLLEVEPGIITVLLIQLFEIHMHKTAIGRRVNMW